MTIAELQQLTIGVLVVGLGLIIFIFQRIIKIVQKQFGSAALWIYLILAAFAAFEFFRLLVLRPAWYTAAWYSSPFLYFWLILLGFSLVQYVKKKRSSK
jgi:hypothetical protein